MANVASASPDANRSGNGSSHRAELRVGGEDVVCEAGAGQDRQKRPLTDRNAGVVQHNRGAVLGNAQKNREMTQEDLQN